MTAPTYAELEAQAAALREACEYTADGWNDKEGAWGDAILKINAALAPEAGKALLERLALAEGSTYPNDHVEQLQAAHDKLQLRVKRAEAALKQIAEHPHCSYERIDPDDRPYSTGAIDGHRCAALIARLALAPAPKEAT